jgi:outer membrane protein
MKNFSSVLSVLSFIGVCILGVLHFRGGRTNVPRKVVKADSTGQVSVNQGAVCAYVDLDSLQDNYNLFKKKKSEFETREKAISQELQAEGQKLESEFLGLQKRAQEGKLGEAEGQAAQKRLGQAQQELEIKKQNQSSKLLKDQDDFNAGLQDNLKGFLSDYAVEKGYDYVFAYTPNSAILYANAADNVTEDVIKALNSGTNYSKKKTDKKEK